jgi:hypothetical protein
MFTKAKGLQKEDGDAQNGIHDKRLANAWV